MLRLKDNAICLFEPFSTDKQKTCYLESSYSIFFSFPKKKQKKKYAQPRSLEVKTYVAFFPLAFVRIGNSTSHS